MLIYGKITIFAASFRTEILVLRIHFHYEVEKVEDVSLRNQPIIGTFDLERSWLHVNLSICCYLLFSLHNLPSPWLTTMFGMMWCG